MFAWKYSLLKGKMRIAIIISHDISQKNHDYDDLNNYISLSVLNQNKDEKTNTVSL